MGALRDTLISYLHPTVSDGFYKYATWERPTIRLPRKCAYSRKWMWNNDTPLKGVYEHIQKDGVMGMVFISETRWISEESYIMLELKGKLNAN